MQTSGFMGVFKIIADWVVRLSLTNILWIIFNLPIAYFVLNLMLVENLNEFVTILLTIVVLAPFFFFPATTAMFAVTRKWILNELDIPIVRSFWEFYKKNYKKSMLGGLIIGLLWIILAIDFYYFTVNFDGAFRPVILIVSILLFIFTLHFISTVVHFDATLFASLKKAGLFTVGKPLLGLGISIITLMMVYVSFSMLTFLIPFFMGSLIALIAFSGFYRVYLKIQSQQKQTLEQS